MLKSPGASVNRAGLIPGLGRPRGQGFLAYDATKDRRNPLGPSVASMVALAVLALALVACGSDESPSNSPAPVPSPTALSRSRSSTSTARRRSPRSLSEW